MAIKLGTTTCCYSDVYTATLFTRVSRFRTDLAVVRRPGTYVIRVGCVGLTVKLRIKQSTLR